MDKNNSQEEYYLTDMVKIACEASLRVMPIRIKDPNEVYGINTKEALKKAQKLYCDDFYS
jgi:bifunctional UDP-N-acetylglucosamine pyrophosphorylase/glucosamine-1-phosphate N-acetyltransferase